MKQNSIQWISELFTFLLALPSIYLEQVSFHTTTSTINKVKGYLIKYENKQQFMQPRSQGLSYPTLSLRRAGRREPWERRLQFMRN